VSASFLSLAAFDVGVAVSGEAAVSADDIKDPPLVMTVRILEQKTLQLKLVGGKEGLNLDIQIPALAKHEWDFKTLQSKLDDFKTKYPKLAEVNVNAEGQVSYKQIIQVIEKIKPAYSKVYLAGQNEKQIQQ
jgi:biopolymer transport protein ExbD